MNCRHCGKPIERVNWANGPGWKHTRGGSLCEHLRAEPPPDHVVPAERPYEYVLDEDERTGH